jgi:activating signal cointegrator 1
MKAITLTQPWAELVSLGVKEIETRSWKTRYRGPLAIHAAMKFPGEAKNLLFKEPFMSALEGSLVHVYTTKIVVFGSEGIMTGRRVLTDNLNLGCIIATCELVDCVFIPMDGAVYRKFMSTGKLRCAIIPPTSPERDFGDYTRGRYAWILANVKTLPKPIPAKGKLGLWEWCE